MTTSTYIEQRGRIETYFDRTAAQTWAKLTSDAPVGRIRASVRAGRDQMRNTLLSWLPENLAGMRLLDAGCGTGAFALEAAARGAQVVAIDLSETLVSLARERASTHPASRNIEFMSGDMLAESLGTFDHVVAMDSVIHYRSSDALQVLSGLAQRTRGSIIFTFAPSTPLLMAMHTVGRAFPKSDRAPAIVPISPRALIRDVQNARSLTDWRCARTQRISSGFYKSQAMELIHL